MLHRFIADLKIESMPSNMSATQDVLDLSKRRDSVETRKTPSPYNTASSCDFNSPKTSPNPMIPSNYGANSPSSYHPALYPGVYYAQPILESMHDTTPLRHYSSFPGAQLNGVFQNRLIGQNHFDIMKTASVLQQQFAERVSSPDQSTDSKEAAFEPAISPKPQPAMIRSKVARNDGKVARPFKAFPRDPATMAATFTATDALLDVQKAEKYRVFRKRMLDQMHASNGGKATVTNPKMRRTSAGRVAVQEEQANDSSNSSEESSSVNPATDNDGNNNKNMLMMDSNGMMKDAAYYERRKKNNAAAKKSRDRRRIKEDEIAVRAAFLEHENIELRIEIAAMKNQINLLARASGK